MSEKKIGLILEGGSMRCMYTAGVLDTFMEEEIHIDGIIGVSAGALFGCNYFSKQKGRVLRYGTRFCKDLRNMSFLNFFLTGNLVGKKFAYYDVTLKYDLFDNETFIQNNTGYYATVTNVKTGKAEYIEMKDVIKDMEVLRATAAIPFVSQLVELNGNHYLDGGVGDSIPVVQAKKIGYDKLVAVLTRPQGYRKKPLSDALQKLLKLKYGKYPEFIKAMLERHIHYNMTIDLIHKMEQKGELFVIRPSQTIDVKTIERDREKLKTAHRLGVNDCRKQLQKLKDYLQS